MKLISRLSYEKNNFIINKKNYNNKKIKKSKHKQKTKQKEKQLTM